MKRFAIILYGRVHQIMSESELEPFMDENRIPLLPPDPVGNPIILVELPDNPEITVGWLYGDLNVIQSIHANNGMRKSKTVPKFKPPVSLTEEEFDYYCPLYQVEKPRFPEWFDWYFEIDSKNNIINVFEVHKKQALPRELSNWIKAPEGMPPIVGAKWDGENITFPRPQEERLDILEGKLDKILDALKNI